MVLIVWGFNRHTDSLPWNAGLCWVSRQEQGWYVRLLGRESRIDVLVVVFRAAAHVAWSGHAVVLGDW